MKNKILLFLVITLMLSMITSCGLLFGQVADSGDISVVIENADGTYDVFDANLDSIENKSEGAKGVIEHLDNKNDSFKVEMIDSTYGAYVSAIGSIRENPTDAMYVMVYTSVATDSYEGAPSINYNGVTLYQSGVGLSGMSVSEGVVILFRLEKSPY